MVPTRTDRSSRPRSRHRGTVTMASHPARRARGGAITVSDTKTLPVEPRCRGRCPADSGSAISFRVVVAPPPVACPGPWLPESHGHRENPGAGALTDSGGTSNTEHERTKSSPHSDLPLLIPLSVLLRNIRGCA